MVRSLCPAFVAFALAALASGCAPVISSAVAVQETGRVEPIYGAAVAGDVAVVRVASNGCTSKADILPHLSRGAGRAVLTVRRTQVDTCSAPAHDGVELRWTFEELGLPSGALVVVNNPLRTDGIIAGQP